MSSYSVACKESLVEDTEAAREDSVSNSCHLNDHDHRTQDDLVDTNKQAGLVHSLCVTCLLLSDAVHSMLEHITSAKS